MWKLVLPRCRFAYSCLVVVRFTCLPSRQVRHCVIGIRQKLFVPFMRSPASSRYVIETISSRPSGPPPRFSEIGRLDSPPNHKRTRRNCRCVWRRLDAPRRGRLPSSRPSTIMASTADRGRFAEIVVIRHGETCWNASRIVQGHLDSELNEIGRQQAVTVAGRLSKEPKFQAIYSSDLKRASETANIIAKVCNLPEVILDPGMRERHLGDIQGLTLRDAAKLKPEAYKIFLSGKRDVEIPGGGESLDQLNERCVSCLEKIASKHQGERVIVLTHGGVLRELHKHAVSGRSSDGRIHNTSVNVFLISESGNWTIKTWGDISHLHEIGVLNSAFGGDRTSG